MNTDKNEEPAKIKDANDLLQVWVGDEMAHEEQTLRVQGALQGAPTVMEEVARWVGSLKGAERDRGLELAFRMVGGLERLQVAQYRSRLCEGMGIGIREFNDMSKATTKEAAEREQEPVYMLGGWVPVEGGQWVVGSGQRRI